MERWDAGQSGGGQLAFEPRCPMERPRPGEPVDVAACDPGAPTDRPARCRMTGRAPGSARHPVHGIQQRKDT